MPHLFIDRNETLRGGDVISPEGVLPVDNNSSIGTAWVTPFPGCPKMRRRSPSAQYVDHASAPASLNARRLRADLCKAP